MNRAIQNIVKNVKKCLTRRIKTYIIVEVSYFRIVTKPADWGRRKQRRCFRNENDISAEKASALEGTRLQKENVHKVGKKDSCGKKTERQKEVICIIWNFGRKHEGIVLAAFFLKGCERDEKHSKLKAQPRLSARL